METCQHDFVALAHACVLYERDHKICTRCGVVEKTIQEGHPCYQKVDHDR